MDEEEILPHRSTSNLAIIWAAIASVGWYIVAITATLFFASPYLSKKYNSWRQRKDEAEYSAKYHKNPDLLEERLRTVDLARQRVQDKYNEQAKAAQEKEEERKRLKKEELLNMMKYTGHKLGTKDDDGASTSTSNSSKLHSEYNPLMGDSSRGYRPPKRSCCGKGCG